MTDTLPYLTSITGFLEAAQIFIDSEDSLLKEIIIITVKHGQFYLYGFKHVQLYAW